MLKNCICDICGQEFLCPSIITLNAGYGSIHDGERLRLELCGDCFDTLFNSALDIKPEGKSGFKKFNKTERNNDYV